MSGTTKSMSKKKKKREKNKKKKNLKKKELTANLVAFFHLLHNSSKANLNGCTAADIRTGRRMFKVR